mgnify:CR=1 FL=1
MKIHNITFNASNWVDGEQTLKYRELKDGRVKFDYRGESWVMSSILREDVGLSTDFLQSAGKRVSYSETDEIRSRP